jgi:hypothetical protein
MMASPLIGATWLVTVVPVEVVTLGLKENSTTNAMTSNIPITKKTTWSIMATSVNVFAVDASLSNITS